MKATTTSATFEPGDLTLLTYAMHMVETARSAPARRLFEEYVEVELRRFEAERLEPKGGRDMKATVDSTTCTGCGLCADTCPEVFEMDGDTAKVRVDKVPPDAEGSCREAMEGCPVEAISIEE